MAKTKTKTKRVGPLTARYVRGEDCGTAIQLFYTEVEPHGLTFYEYKPKKLAKLFRRVAKWLEKQ